jgi:tRNA A37 threonylcarbamoyladenosine dehydratase
MSAIAPDPAVAALVAPAAAIATKASAAVTHEDPPPDLERRFGGLRRLYGDAGYARLRAGRFAVVGLGGVGSWVAEALARCGVAELLLFDLDHVAESNINRQVQALTPTLGQAKVQALRERIALIHPGCLVHAVEEFVAADNWPGLLPAASGGIDVLIDACDQVRAKEALARWSLAERVPSIVVGAAGGKQRPEAVQVADLADVTHDPLLAALRQRLRHAGAIPRQGGAGSSKKLAAGLTCVFSREPVGMPASAAAAAPMLPEACAAEGGDGRSGDAGPSNDGSLNCHGYGSSVMVTATFGMVAAGAAIAQLLELAPLPTR